MFSSTIIPNISKIYANTRIILSYSVYDCTCLTGIIMGFTCCKNKCITYERSSKHTAYRLGGCFCKNCDYYFKEKFSRCPCCNTHVRYSTRSNKNKQDSEIVRI